MSTDLKEPSTSDTSKWVIENPSLECTLSAFQVDAWPKAATETTKAMAINLIFFIRKNLNCFLIDY
jgi:hypothetical protein